ncbi:MAG: hydroxyethylthiazole kinase [Thermodesulfobacteriota bacterium]
MELNKYTAFFNEKIRKESPLIHNITNFVVMNSSANILLASGASPVMAHAPEEAADMASVSGAVVLNIGTLTKEWIESMIMAGQSANKNNVPVILDPVGSGATDFRTDCVEKILKEVKIDVIRGNLSEIMSLAGGHEKTRGVDSSIAGISSEIIEKTKELAKKYKNTISVSGETDIITDGDNLISVKNGDPLLTKITGMGCGLSAVTAAFCAVSDKNFTKASACAAAYYGLCAEKAGEISDKPGSFYVNFIDSLYSLTQDEIENKTKF